MRLQSIKYIEYPDTQKEWTLTDCSFKDINLIVGINSVGKSRTIRIIRGLAKLLISDGVVSFNNGEYNVLFQDEKKLIKYSLKYVNNKIIYEKLFIDETLKLDRKSKGKSRIFIEGKIENFTEFHIEHNILACVKKRDKIQHPYLEYLYNWAKNTYAFEFGTELGQKDFGLDAESLRELRLRNPENLVSIFNKAIKRNPLKYKKAVKEDFSLIGYPISDAGTTNIKATLQDGQGVFLEGLYVQEKDLMKKTTQADMSQGMFRVYSLIIQINALMMVKRPGCILIDDIGEGLDNRRAKSLISLLIKKAKASQIQLIMSSNDQFVMNEVPIEYWSLMHRIKSTVKVYNYENAKLIFDEFAYTGLSNFDFFTSKYFLKKPKKNVESSSNR